MNLKFGKNLKMLRHQKDMTQDELAQKLSLSVQAISRYETGAAYPDIEMLPVIAGFFDVTIDQLLGVSSEAKDKRMDYYLEEVRKLTDRRERLALLRKQHAEFPTEWTVVNDMVYEMTFIPECLDEMREIVDDAMKNCSDNMWRGNMIFSYLKSESDEDKANLFIDKYASHYDMRKVQLLKERYSSRGEHEKSKCVRQKILSNELEHSLYLLTEQIDSDILTSYKSCHHVLTFIEHLSDNRERTKPDMWTNVRLMVMLRLANNCFMLSKEDEGFSVLCEAVTLFENFFTLENGTALTYGTPLLDQLSTTTEKAVFYGITEFSGIIAKSIMINLEYQTPIGYVNKDDNYSGMDGFERMTVFSEHTYSVLKSANWHGFNKIKYVPRYIALLKRAKAVASVESIHNLMFLMDSEKNRTDDYVKGKKWVCALLVKDVGAYIFDDATDIEEKFERMQREGNTLVNQVAAVEFGGGFIELPEIIKKRLMELNQDNKNAQVVRCDNNGDITYTKI